MRAISRNPVSSAGKAATSGKPGAERGVLCIAEESSGAHDSVALPQGQSYDQPILCSINPQFLILLGFALVFYLAAMRLLKFE